MRFRTIHNKLLESKHNIIYWRGGDYVGIGPGAHGRLTLAGKRQATRTALAPKAWLERVAVQNEWNQLIKKI